MNQCGHQFYCFRINGSLLEVRPDVVVDVVVGSSTLILQELTNRNEMLVVFHERCCACAVLYAVWYNQCGHQFYCFRMNGSLLEVRPDVVVDVVVGSSTLILQELTNRNEMLVVFHEHCCACAVLYAVWYRFYCSECTDYSWKFVFRSSSAQITQSRLGEVVTINNNAGLL